MNTQRYARRAELRDIVRDTLIQLDPALKDHQQWHTMRDLLAISGDMAKSNAEMIVKIVKSQPDVARRIVSNWLDHLYYVSVFDLRDDIIAHSKTEQPDLDGWERVEDDDDSVCPGWKVHEDSLSQMRPPPANQQRTPVRGGRDRGYKARGSNSPQVRVPMSNSPVPPPECSPNTMRQVPAHSSLRAQALDSIIVPEHNRLIPPRYEAPVKSAPVKSALKPVDLRVNLLICTQFIEGYEIQTYQSTVHKSVINYTVDMKHSIPNESYRFKLCLDDLKKVARSELCRTISDAGGVRYEFSIETDANGNSLCKWMGGSRTIIRPFKDNLIVRVAKNIVWVVSEFN